MATLENQLKRYDLIAIGTGSGMSIVDAMLQERPDLKVAVIDKDEPGGICLTRGCIPSKILLYPAELIRSIEGADVFGLDIRVENVDFQKTMNRMRSLIHHDIDRIRESLSEATNIDYYPYPAEFVAPYTLETKGERISAKMIFLCTGSRPLIPPIKGLAEVGYLTSDTLLELDSLPKSVAIVGGGYIAAEYGHFLSAMGSQVTIVGRNPQFLPDEEPEISALAKRELGNHIKIMTGHEVIRAERSPSGEKSIVAVNKETGEEVTFTSEEILVASGRASNSDILRPEKGGVKTDANGWIAVDDFLQTSQTNVWALGDATGRYQFKHVANYEALVVYNNAVLGGKMKADYHAVPHAVFTYPEIASVGMREKEAIQRYGIDKILVGVQRYQDTAKGEAINAKDYFVKVIVEGEELRILGAHIIGPQASVLIHEIIPLMYVGHQTALPIRAAMHIHPALSEVVDRAFSSLMTPEQYHHLMEHHFNLPLS